MAPPRPDTFEKPDLGTINEFTRFYLPEVWQRVNLPVSRFRKRLTNTKQYLSMVYRTHFDDNPQVDDLWEPHAVLGQGGYGIVGVFKKRDPLNNDIVDELALKTVQFKYPLQLEKHLWAANLNIEDLLSEAVIQRQLNNDECENIVHLRGYKCFRERHERIAKREYKFYLEYAPYDTLNALRLRYRYYHQYLPEPFLWHVFDSLAFAAVTMKKFSKDNLPFPNQRSVPQGAASLVHFDIKLENVVLGYPEPYGGNDKRGGTRVYDYPTIKLGDFGLARLLDQEVYEPEQDEDESDRAEEEPEQAEDEFESVEDESESAEEDLEEGEIEESEGEVKVPGPLKNPVDLLGYGTPARRPPEQVHYGAYWPRPPNSHYDGVRQTNSSPFNRKDGTTFVKHHILRNPRNLSFKFAEKANVWAIGKIMFDLMGLHTPSKLWRLATRKYDRYQRSGEHMLHDFDRVPFAKFSSSGRSPYSKLLTDLVKDCLKPSIDSRPDVTELRAATESGMDMFEHQYHVDCEELPASGGFRDTDHPKLFWRDDEINDMPEGPESFSNAYGEYRRMQQGRRTDPDWPELRPSFDRNAGPPDFRIHHETYLLKHLSKKHRLFKKRFQVVYLEEVELRIQDQSQKSPVYSDSNDEDDESEHYYQQETGGGDTEDDGSDSNSDDGPGDKQQPQTAKRRREDEAEVQNTSKRRRSDDEENSLFEVLLTGQPYSSNIGFHSAQSVLGIPATPDAGETQSQPASPSRASPPRAQWTNRYAHAYALAVAQRIPELPPDVDPADDSFHWDTNQRTRHWGGLFLRTVGDKLQQWDVRTQRWKGARVYKDTADNRRRRRVGKIY